MDKSFWTSVAKNDCAVPAGHTAAGLLPDLLVGLGSTDPELRDNLCLEILCTWVYEGPLSPAELRPLTDQLLRNLRQGIGQGENDQVFIRTFSALVLRWVISRDAKSRFLTDQEVHRVLDEGLAYLADEHDLRGYIPEKGWAHSAAHTADLLAALAEHPALDAADLMRILQAIGAKVLTPTDYAFRDREGYRLAKAVIAVLNRDSIPLEDVTAWLEGLGGGGQPRSKTYVAGKDNARHHNAEALLAGLHLMLEYKDVSPATRSALLPAVHGALKSFLPWFL